MSKNKYTTPVCIIIVLAMLAATGMFLSGATWGLESVRREPQYASTLFDTRRMHTIDIQVRASEWDDMIANAQDEAYIQATVVIDGEKVSGVGLRPKGNSSLSMIARSDSDRYSFKVEFDHYANGLSYHGLDKLALNNIAQDNTYMKDYISYRMMNAMGANAPLSSFIWVTVNGEDWGLYLAAEGVDESFAQRVYGNDFGEIYKPDSMDMGDMRRGEGGENFGGGRGEAGAMPDFGGRVPNPGEMPEFRGGERPDFGGATSLVYTDDDPDSYAAIFDHAVFKTSDADKKRLIESLKKLNAGEDIEQIADVEEIIRYFVVHNFVLNSDSYTGNIVHNYYLAEKDGQLSMIAWDYNLAFGGMGGFGGRAVVNIGEADGQSDMATAPAIDTATRYVNYPIDSPLLSGSAEDRPMIAWIFENETYLEMYHEIFAEYVAYFTGGAFAAMYDEAITLISPYVEKDPSAFCTYEDFQKGNAALREFCLLRAASVSGQLGGSIASTSEAQTATSNANFVDASGVDMESMGSNSMGFGRARGEGGFPGAGRFGGADPVRR